MARKNKNLWRKLETLPSLWVGVETESSSNESGSDDVAPGDSSKGTSHLASETSSRRRRRHALEDEGFETGAAWDLGSWRQKVKSRKRARAPHQAASNKRQRQREDGEWDRSKEREEEELVESFAEAMDEAIHALRGVRTFVRLRRRDQEKTPRQEYQASKETSELDASCSFALFTNNIDDDPTLW